MKKLLLSLFALCTMMSTRADEGMWIPMLIGKNYNDMVRLGLKLTPEEIYSINKSSMKDAIVQFAGGCTGEIISPSGLLLTNHHCGYGAIAGLSTVDKNYLDNGFWAHSFAEELPAKGITALFLDHVEDVTNEVTRYAGRYRGEQQSEKLQEIYKKITARNEQGGKYVAHVREYFNGNQYLLLVYKLYTDVRLVATPPKSLGKYGGDTDNWMWPRHTADFSIFRVYAGKDNEPAEYSPSNVPLKPKHHLPVSIKGYEEKDFAMIMGYPGRTNRYETASGVDLAINEVNPSIVKLRDERLAIMRKYMAKDKDTYLKLTGRYQNIANYWKYFIGQTEQLKRLKVVDRKKQEEANFLKWADRNNTSYSSVIRDYNNVYSAYKPYAKSVTYYSEGFRASDLARLAASTKPLAEELKKRKPNQDTIKKLTADLKRNRSSIVKGMHKDMDKEIFAATTRMIYEDVPKAQLPDIYANHIFKKYGSNDYARTFNQYAEDVYTHTFLLNDDQFNAFVDNPTLAVLESDPATGHALSFVRNFEENINPRYEAYNYGRRDVSKRYLKGLMEMNKGKLMYPDANSTMRLTYGQVLAYEPQDAVYYNYYTTIEGLMDKYKPGDDEFDLPLDFINLVNAKDFGPYADKKSGTLHACFITNNDITGGNSGSPVINGNGELIGCAFDGNWEAMSGDISFDKNYKRTINVDIRFILWLIEYYGRADNIIKEMEIRR